MITPSKINTDSILLFKKKSIFELPPSFISIEYVFFYPRFNQCAFIAFESSLDLGYIFKGRASSIADWMLDGRGKKDT